MRRASVGADRAARLAALLGTAVALGACGGDASEDSDQEAGVGQPIAGSVAPLAQCSDWKNGSEEARVATIDDIQAQLNQGGSDGPTPDLPDDEAYDLFERACSNRYAAGFRLYKVYARAAAFAPLVELDPRPREQR
jgi:hypothetical protein